MENNKIIRLHTVDNGSFDFDPSVPCIISSGKGFMTSQEFRAYMEHGLTLIKEKIKEYGKLGWLPDVRESSTFIPEDTAWLTRWNSDAYEAGVRYCAFVMPVDVFAKMCVEDYTEYTAKTNTIVVKHFKDIESAKDWLREVLNE